MDTDPGPRRVQQRRTAGWRKPEGAIACGRGTPPETQLRQARNVDERRAIMCPPTATDRPLF